MKRRQRAALVPLAILLCWCAAPASGHYPHDDVYDLAVSPRFSADRTVFAVVRGAVFRSVDGGYVWSRQALGPVCPEVDEGLGSVMTVSPAFASDRTLFFSCDQGKMYVSRNAGNSWSPAGPDVAVRVKALEISPAFASDRTLLALGEGELHRTRDAGQSWNRIFDPGLVATTVRWLGEEMLVGTRDGGLYHSADAGDSWRPLGQLPKPVSITHIEVPHAARLEEALFVGTAGAGVFAAEKSDASFHFRSAGIPDGHVTSLASTRRDGQLVLLATTRSDALYKSEDRGGSWRLYSAGLQKNDQATMFKKPQFRQIVVADDSTFFLASYSGIAMSRDGGRSWRLSEPTLHHVLSLDASPASNGAFSVGFSSYAGGAIVSGDGGDTWEIRNIGLPMRGGTFIYSPTFTEDRTVFNTAFGYLVRSTDGGRSWEMISIDPPLYSLDGIEARVVRGILNRFDSPLVRRLLEPLTEPYFLGYLPPTPIAVAISPRFSQDGTLFLGMMPNGVLRSTDGGSTFALVWDSQGERVRALVISPDSRVQTLFAGLSDGVYRSVDAGESWKRAGGELELGTRSVLRISPQFAKDRTLFAGGRAGLFRSRDAGDTWEPLPIDGSHLPISNLAISPFFASDGELLVQVRGGDLYRCRSNGDEFQARTSGAAAQGYSFSGVISRGTGAVIRYSPNYDVDHTVYAASMQQLLESKDGGSTWRELRTPARYEVEASLQDWFVLPISLAGKWELAEGPGHSARRVVYASEPDSTLTLDFVGGGVTWLGTRGPDRGKARVYIDGELRAEADQYAAELEYLAPSFSAAGLSPGPHSLKIAVDGSRNEKSTGQRVDVDAIDVTR